MGSVRRNALIAAGAIAVLGALAPAGAPAQDAATAASPATITVPSSDRGTRDYGEDRAARTFTLALDADKVLPSAPAVTLGDARRKGDGRPLKGTVSAASELVAGGRQIKVAVTVDPEDGIDDGTYLIPLHVRANEIKPADFRPQVEYSHTPPIGARWALALVALIIGLSAGGALRWLSDKGTKLRDLLGRRDLLRASLGSMDHVPAGLSRDLMTLELLLAQDDAARAEAKLAAIEPGLPKLLAALDALARARAELVRQHELIAAPSSAGDPDGRLQRVVSTEQDQLDSATDDAYPNPDDKKDARTALAVGVFGFTAFLVHYRTAESRTEPEFEAALALYLKGDFAGAQAAWDKASAGPVADDVAETPLALPAAPAASRWTWWAARNAPVLIGLATGLGLVLVGLLTVFKPDAMFLTQDVRDFLVLIAWGFGSALTGMTLAQLAAKATAPAG